MLATETSTGTGDNCHPAVEPALQCIASVHRANVAAGPTFAGRLILTERLPAWAIMSR
jgi:hypothetical protein